MKESPLFAKSYDFLKWLLLRTTKFPKAQRFVMARRVEECALGFYEALIEAGKSPGKKEALCRADLLLEQLRLHLRLCMDLTLLSFNQYEYAAKEVTEIGRLLGAWIKKT